MIQRIKVECPICGKLISRSNISKHQGSKSCLELNKKLFTISDDWRIDDNLYECPICKKQYSKQGMVNHYYRKHIKQGIEFAKTIGNKTSRFNTLGKPAWNKGQTKENNEILKQAGIKLHNRYINGELVGAFKGKHHSDETKLKQSIAARNSDHRRLVRSCRYYTTKSGEQILLDSSWEERLVKLLDEKNYNWERPKHTLKWIDKEGINHNYFPDFYLIDYDLYLDPKNPQACKVQKEKLDILNEMYNNIIILHSEDEIDRFEEFIK